jgi:hypothetical protein
MCGTKRLQSLFKKEETPPWPPLGNLKGRATGLVDDDLHHEELP